MFVGVMNFGQVQKIRFIVVKIFQSNSNQFLVILIQSSKLASKILTLYFLNKYNHTIISFSNCIIHCNDIIACYIWTRYQIERLNTLKTLHYARTKLHLRGSAKISYFKKRKYREEKHFFFSFIMSKSTPISSPLKKVLFTILLSALQLCITSSEKFFASMNIFCSSNSIQYLHSGTLGCHLLQDLKVPGSNLDND